MACARSWVRAAVAAAAAAAARAASLAVSRAVSRSSVMVGTMVLVASSCVDRRCGKPWLFVGLLACESASIVLRVTVGVWLGFARCRGVDVDVDRPAGGCRLLAFAFYFARRRGVDVLYLVSYLVQDVFVV